MTVQLNSREVRDWDKPAGTRTSQPSAQNGRQGPWLEAHFLSPGGAEAGPSTEPDKPLADY